MNYKNIKRFLSFALLIAFSTPTIAISYDAPTLRSSTQITSDVKLTTKNDTITLSLRDSDVKQVLRMFADKVGMNIVFHKSVDGKVTLDLVNTPVNEAFNLVLQVAGLNYYKEANTMIVIAKADPDNAIYSKQELLIFPIKYVSAGKIADFLNKNVFGMKKSGLSSVDAATVNTATNELIVFGMPNDIAIVEKVIAQFDREPYSKTFTVNHTTPAEMAKMVCNMLGSNDGVVTGGAASVKKASEDTTLKLGEGVVACSVANTAESANVSPFNAQNLSITYFPQRGSLTMLGGSEAQAHLIEKFIKDNDIKQPQAMLEVSIVELNEAGSKEFENIWQIAGKNWSANFDGKSFSGGRSNTTPWTSSTQYIFNGGTNIDEMKAGALPNGNPYGIYDDTGTKLTGMVLPEMVARTIYSQIPSVHVQWQMNYLIENKKARVLANPKILITNGQESTIDLTQDYVEKVTSQFLSSSMSTATATGAVQKDYTIGDDLGIKVVLTPFISPQGYVTLNITPEYSTVAGQEYTIGATGTSELAATLLNRRNLNLKNVRIKDGETLVIGGMIQETESKIVNKIPILGDLPVVGALFRSSSTSKTKSELVIMITPKIINDDETTVDNV